MPSSGRGESDGCLDGIRPGPEAGSGAPARGSGRRQCGSRVAGHHLAAVDGRHVRESGERVHALALGQSVQLGVRAVRVRHQPLALGPLRELPEVRLPGRLQGVSPAAWDVSATSATNRMYRSARSNADGSVGGVRDECGRRRELAVAVGVVAVVMGVDQEPRRRDARGLERGGQRPVRRSVAAVSTSRVVVPSLTKPELFSVVDVRWRRTATRDRRVASDVAEDSETRTVR